jgi:hypothetical protein
MPDALAFHPLFVLRSPTLPFSTPVFGDQVSEKLRDPFFQQALYLASPDLYATATRPGPLAPGCQASCLNYLNRMRSRSTPFGLFAACSLVPWQAGGPILLGAAAQRHTRLDMHYVCNLAQAFTRLPPVAEHLLYFPNSSVYQIGDQIRYLECQYENGHRIHQYNAVHASGPLLTLLQNSRSGLTRAGLYDLIGTPDLDPAEIKHFIDDLIAAQVLVSELEPVLTGTAFSARVLQVAARIQARHPDPAVAVFLAAFRQVTAALRQLDDRPQARPADYEKIRGMLPALAPASDKNKLFQVDLIRPVLAGGLSPDLRQELLDFIPLFKNLSPGTENPRLEDFRRRCWTRMPASGMGGRRRAFSPWWRTWCFPRKARPRSPRHPNAPAGLPPGSSFTAR